MNESIRMSQECNNKVRNDILLKKTNLLAVNREKTEAMRDGDGFHNELGQRIEGDAQMLDLEVRNLEKQISSCDFIMPPLQNEKIDVGHMVKITFESNNSKKKVTTIHILSSFDSLYLNSNDDDSDVPSVFVVSETSPLGKALLGSNRGKTVRYNEGLKATILDDEDAIKISTYLK